MHLVDCHVVMCEVLLGSSCAQIRNMCCKLAHAHKDWNSRLENDEYTGATIICSIVV